MSHSAPRAVSLPAEDTVPQRERRAGTFAKLGVIGSLYIAFGMASGFFQTALPAIFRQRGVSLEAIGLFALLYLPFGLSFLWAPLVDRYYIPRVGRRRSWMLGCQLVSGAALLVAASAPPETRMTATLARLVFSAWLRRRLMLRLM
jgi:MFS family permease